MFHFRFTLHNDETVSYVSTSRHGDGKKRAPGVDESLALLLWLMESGKIILCH